MTAPSIAQRFSNIKHMPSLMAATIANEKPIDAYLMRDIIKMTYESAQTRVFLQDYLCNLLLTSRNVFVKSKAAQLLISCVEEGHEEFRTNLKRQPEPIKETSRLRTNNERLLGDCGRIRDMATKLLNMLYNEEWTRPPPKYLLTAPKVAEGQGFAMPVGQTVKQTGFMEGVRSLASQVGLTGRQRQVEFDEDYVGLQSVPFNTTQHQGVAVGSATPSVGIGVIQTQELEGQEHVRGRAGGGWDYGEVAAPPRHTQEATPTVIPTVNEGVAETDHTQSTDRELESEVRLVESITQVGGVRVAPPRDQLQQFVERSKALDTLAIIDLLRVKLQSSNHQVVLRTLCVFEAFLRSDIPGVDRMCDLALHELASLSASTNHAIRTKATKIVHSLGLEGAEQSRGKPDKGSLLELAPPTVGGAASEPHPQSSGGLLDGLTVVSNGQPQDPPPQADGGLSALFGNMAVESSQPVLPPPVPTGDSLLDFSGEDDTELDPLKRSDSTSSGFITKSGNFNFERTGSNASGFLTKSGNFNFGLSEAPPAHQTVGPTHQTVASAHQTVGPTHAVSGGFPSMAVPANTGLHYTPMHTDFPPSGVLLSNYGLSAVSTPLAASQGYTPGGVYHVSLQARPVQRVLPREASPEGFGFISKQSKGEAFDFVQAEMTRAKGK